MLGTRLFFFGTIVICAFLLLTVFLNTDSAIATREVTAGLAVWRVNGCEGCHTIYGQGGAYAPDLTQVLSQRGDAYVREFLIQPAAFHPGQRAMPRFGLTAEETEHLLAFLRLVDEGDIAWPPRAILVTGGADLAPQVAFQEDDLPDDPVSLGRYWFSRPPAACATCHSLEPDINIVGPSLAGLASRAANRVPGMSAEAYIRDSILHPGNFVVPGFQNVMAQNLAEILNSDQINQIVTFLLTLE